MHILDKSEYEQIDIAHTSTSVEILNELSHSRYVAVRRSVAKNINATKDILNRLCLDPSENVTYIACKNPQVDYKREIKSNNRCVICNADERDYKSRCQLCKNLN